MTSWFLLDEGSFDESCSLGSSKMYYDWFRTLLNSLWGVLTSNFSNFVSLVAFFMDDNELNVLCLSALLLSTSFAYADMLSNINLLLYIIYIIHLVLYLIELCYDIFRFLLFIHIEHLLFNLQNHAFFSLIRFSFLPSIWLLSYTWANLLLLFLRLTLILICEQFVFNIFDWSHGHERFGSDINLSI